MVKPAHLSGRVFARPTLTAPSRAFLNWRSIPFFVLLAASSAFAQSPAKPDSVMLDDPASVEYFDPTAKSASLNKLDPAAKTFALDIGARVIAPSKATKVAFDGTRQRMYIQFTRPLTAEERGDIIRSGAQFHEALGKNTYLVTLTEAGYAALQQNPLFRGSETMKYVDKLTREVYYGNVGKHAKTAAGALAVHVRFHADVSLEQALALLDQYKTSVDDRSRFLLDNRLRVEAPAAVLHAIAEAAIVREIVAVPAPPQDDNVNAAAMSNIDVLQAAPFNLSGNGVNMGHWEGGQVLATHQDLTGRVTLVEVGSPGDHATHVAGTMMSSGANDPLARGMAPAANLFSWINNGDVPTEMADGVTNQEISTANHSWGISNTNGVPEPDQSIFGLYDASARGWDVAIAASGLIVCNSSGNDNTDTDGMGSFDGILATGDGLRYHTIDSAGNAKNNITVGNLSDDAVNIRASSSTGPTDDGRIKPNIVANGDSLYSTSFNAGNPGDNAFYEFMGGTSMATPTVAGAAALLVERWRLNNSDQNPAAETIKALLIHTATDLGIAGPDNIYGYGLMDAEAALGVLDAAAVRVVTDAVDVDETDDWKVPVTAGTPELRVTLVWTDPAGAVNADPALVNNLNLELEGPDGVVRFPFTSASAGAGPTAANVDQPATTTGPNDVDNVEQVLVPTPAAGFWTARVVGGDGVQVGPQNYALVSNIAFLLPYNPQISVNAPLDFNEICEGKKQDIRVSIFNTGGVALDVNSVTVTAGAEHFSVLANPVMPVSIAPGAHVDVTVRYAPTSVGLHNGTLSISSNDPDEPTLDFAMTGEGGAGDAFVSLPSNGSFGDVCGDSQKELALTISNNGTCPLTVTGVSSDSPEFLAPSGENEISVASPRVIAPGGSLQVPIRFQPVLPFGAKSGTITILTNDPDPAQATITRSVSGNYPAPVIDINPCPITFNEACLENEASLTKVVNICNTGLCPLTIQAGGIRFDPPTTEFEILTAPTYPVTIAPGAECYPITIHFTPTSPGDKAATLVVDGDGGVTKSCEVTGTVADLEDALQMPERLAFRPTVIRDNAPCNTDLPLPLTNIGNVCGVQITGITITGDDADQFSIVGVSPNAYPTTIAPGEIFGDGNLAVRFHPRKLVTKRFLTAEVQVTYVTDPRTAPPTTVTKSIPIAGEATQSGLRLRVLVNGAPADIVKSVKIKQQGGTQLINLKNVVQKSVTGPMGFDDVLSFDYHVEAGGLSAPDQSLTGNYRVTAKVKVGKRTITRNVNLSIASCDFNDELVINF